MPQARVDTVNAQPRPLELESLGALAKQIWEAEAGTEAQVTLIFVDQVFMTRLNRDFKGVDGPTDVLAFPYSEPGALRFEGEIYVCVDAVRENARRFRCSFRDELRRVVVHGVLHFLGYEDHSEDGERIMRDRETHYLLNKP